MLCPLYQLTFAWDKYNSGRMCQLHYKLAEGSPNGLDSQGCHWSEPFKDQKHLDWSTHHSTERARRNGDRGWMTLHRLIRELQVDEWVSGKAWLQKCWQGDPGGQAMSRRHRGWRVKGACHRGGHALHRETGGQGRREWASVGTGTGVSQPYGPGAPSLWCP